MKKEAIRYLDRMEELNMNAAIFQVRPVADAFYKSSIEPWSAYLTGKQGRDPGFDPLQFWIEEAHKRNIELHAWFNPYRAAMSTSTSGLSSKSIVKAKPHLVKTVGRYKWQIPTSEESRQHTLDVIMEVVRNYDIDGVHLDDYFYPYNNAFPDSDLYAAYQKAGGKLSKGSWRRHGVNTLIVQIRNHVKTEKHDILFGISPFGIWRPGNPRGITGLDAYSKISADSRRWLREGWVDYLTPQLYWTISSKGQSFPKLLEWWNDQNVSNKYVWPGIRGRSSQEMINQIEIINRNNSGVAIFHIGSLMKDTPQTRQLQSIWSTPTTVPPAK